MNFPVDFGLVQIGLILLLVVGVALIVSGLIAARRVGMRALLARGTGGLALLLVAVVLLWIATLLQTYLGLTGEIKAAHVVAKPCRGRNTSSTSTSPCTATATTRNSARPTGSRAIWGTAIGHRRAGTVGERPGLPFRLPDQPPVRPAPRRRRDHAEQIFLNEGDQDFFADMREGRWGPSRSCAPPTATR
ncbi:hypothetical protein [Nocardia abscessus]|uniref:hypothetical protein n=1 Tax=Nocardia abscessus TaxID=120957 RepID=UPI001D1513C7|nr:hypothetical protein [Nocardia abscessus]MCC3333623.1 hypothetical protein [Nocardia abscessus]